MNWIDSFLADPYIALGNVVATSYLIPLGLFIVRYFVWSPWWDNELGIALLLQKIGFFLVFVLIVLGNFFPDWGARPALRLAVFAGVGFTLWLDVVNLRRVQRRYPFNAVRATKPRLRDIARKYIRP